MSNKENKIEKIFILIIGIISVFMSVLMPIWQTPDEMTHLEIIGSSINNDQFAELLVEDIGNSKETLVLNIEDKVDWQKQKSIMTKAPTYDRIQMMPQGIKLSIISHFPATLAMLITILIGLPTYWVLQFGEFASIGFYLLVVYYAIKIMPIKKEMLCVCVALPMALQQAGSIGYDAVVIPLCFLFIAYVFRLKFDESPVTLREISLLFLLWLLISYIKMPYTFLGFLVILIPLKQYRVVVGKITFEEKLIKKLIIPICVLLGIILILGIYIFRNNRWIQVVFGCLTEWERTIFLLKQTIIYWGRDLAVGIVGNFGWLDFSVGVVIAAISYVFIVFVSIFAREERGVMRIKDRVGVLLVAIVLIFFTTLSMVNHTIMVTLYGSESANGIYNIHEALYQIPYIGGLQGRYFLPILPLVFLPLPQICKRKMRFMWAYVFGFIMLIGVYALCLMIDRYWLS